jgi:hypothetical protein
MASRRLFDGAIIEIGAIPIVGPAPTSYNGGVLKRWNGSQWILAEMNTYNGSTWVNKPLKRWDGSQWLSINNTGI